MTRSKLIWFCTVLFVLIGGWLVKDSYGSTAITWMYVFEAKDIVGWAGLLSFYKQLRIAVPPFWAALDILSYQAFGDYRINAIWLYRIAMVGSFLLAGSIFKGGLIHRCGSLLIGLYFLATSVQIHPGNPGVVDFFFPALVLIMYWSLARAKRGLDSGETVLRLVVLTGFSFTLTELTRPFLIYMTPFIFLGFYLALRRAKLKTFLVLAIPVLLFSGTWHAHHLINFGQVAWTNHSGVNLMRVWDPVMGDWQSLVEPEEPPIVPGRMNNINTEVHSRNSDIMKKMVVEGIIAHPRRALIEATWNLKILLDGKTCLMKRCPEHWILKPYKAVVRIAVGIFVLGLLATIFRLFLDKENRITIISSPEIQLIGFTVLSILLLAFGDKGEDARFLISVLPLICVFPGLGNVRWSYHRFRALVKQQRQ